MASIVIRRKVKIQSGQLEWLILVMAGTVMAAVQIISCVFAAKGYMRGLLDWAFFMSLITLVVHFSFRQINKIQEELITKEEDAEESRKSLQHVIDHTEDAIIVLDRNGDFIFANKPIEKIMGHPVGRVLKMNIGDTLCPQDRRLIMDKLQGVAPTDLIKDTYYCDIVHQDGSKIPVRMNLMPTTGRNGQVSGFQVIIRDVGENNEIERSRQEKERYLRTIAKIAQIMLKARTGLPYRDILEALGLAANATSASLVLHGENVSSEAGVTDTIEWKLNDAEISEDLQKDQAVSQTDEGCESEIQIDGETFKGEFSSDESYASNYRAIGSTLILPLVLSEKCEGLLRFGKNGESGNWNPIQVNLLTTAASMIAGAIERQKANKQLKVHFLSLAKTVSSALFFVDPYTANHQNSVAEMALFLGNRLGLDSERCEWLYFGGLVHDIGKATIPTSILSKPGQLTNEEWTLVKSHVNRGCDILKDIELPQQVIDMVSSHHERLDGSGYPCGVTGDQLGLETRILAVCDVVEAMSSHRPYRPARTKEEIRAELTDRGGRKYDSQIVELILEMIENKSNSDDLKNKNLLAAV